MSTWGLCCLCSNSGTTTESFLHASERRSFTMKHEVPGCDEGVLEDRRRAKFAKGPLRGLGISRKTREGCSWRERVWRPVKLGTQQKPRGLVRSMPSFEATAGEWRLQDGAFHLYCAKVTRSCDLAASQNRPPIVSHSQGPVLLRALSSASETTEMRPGSG